ncbi:MAG: hypothetical protein FWH44_05775 [Methanomassiliicoccaceae archaeon]|nr:hypothetical protein [Methanomassiliicoccaceae archaeon]
MATQSFDEMMIIDTPEKARNLEAAFWEAERRGPLKFEGPSFEELLRREDEFIKNNLGRLKEAAAAAKARQIERGELPESDE